MGANLFKAGRGSHDLCHFLGERISVERAAGVPEALPPLALSSSAGTHGSNGKSAVFQCQACVLPLWRFSLGFSFLHNPKDYNESFLLDLKHPHQSSSWISPGPHANVTATFGSTKAPGSHPLPLV